MGCSTFTFLGLPPFRLVLGFSSPFVAFGLRAGYHSASHHCFFSLTNALSRDKPECTVAKKFSEVESMPPFFNASPMTRVSLGLFTIRRYFFAAAVMLKPKK